MPSLEILTTMISDGSNTTLDRSTSTSTSTSTSPPWSTSTNNDDFSEVAPAKSAGRKLQHGLTRRTHTKSRNGCFSCKQRKIKCGEEKPACKNCHIKANVCIYRQQPSQPHPGYAKRHSLSASLSPVSYNFTLQDMLFFHHFLTQAYPHLPLGNDSVWVKDIPRFAHEHSYLMHAMLALGASHLGQISPNNPYEQQALQHRGSAITGLNDALTKSVLAYGEADAILATCYALTFQSAHMPDGMGDFVTFVRGCAIATGRIRHVGADTAFDIRPDRYFDVVKPRLRRLPPINLLHVFAALDGLDGVRQYIKTKADMEFFNALYGVYSALQTSSQDGYIEFVKIYVTWCDMSAEDFKILLDPENITGQILSAYFIATELIMAPLTVLEAPERTNAFQRRTLTGIVSWAEEIYKRVPARQQHLLQWPKSIVATAYSEITGMPQDGPAVLFVDVKEPVTEDYRDYFMEHSLSPTTPAMIAV